VAKATKATDVEAFTAQTALVWGKLNNGLPTCCVGAITRGTTIYAAIVTAID